MSDSSENNQPSPLSEADPESLDELFSRIDKKLILGLPNEITNSDIEKVVKYYRNLREQFLKDQANFIKPGRGRTSTKMTKEFIENLKKTSAPMDF